MSNYILYLVEIFKVNDRIESNHMPVELYRKCQVDSDTRNIQEEAVKRDQCVRYLDRINTFQEHLLSQAYRERMTEAHNHIGDCHAKTFECSQKTFESG